MPKSPALLLNTRDDRREIHQLLERLAPADRLAWLTWCCRQVKGKHLDKVRPRRGWRAENALEVWLDFWQLCVSYDLDPTPAANRLERLAARRGAGRRLLTASGV